MLSTLHADPGVFDSVSAHEPRAMTEARRSREQAQALLRSLETAKAECDACLSESDRTDAMQSVRGESSLDHAIESTRRMIRDLDRAISG